MVKKMRYWVLRYLRIDICQQNGDEDAYHEDNKEYLIVGYLMREHSVKSIEIHHAVQRYAH